MLRLLRRKWWLTLIQGILLVILSFNIFLHPVAVLGGLSFWIGLIVLISGAIGIIAWMIGRTEEKETMSLLWSLVTSAMGILMLSNVLVMMKALTLIFGSWMLLAGLAVVVSGWKSRKEHSLGWGAIATGLLAALGGLGMIFNINAGAIGISSLLGISVMMTGIAIILLALIKRTTLKHIQSPV